MQPSVFPLILLNILGWSSYAGADVLGKYLSQDYGISQILMIASSIAATFLASWIVIQKGWRGFLSPALKWHLIRGFLVFGTSFFVMNSISRIPLADFYGITFTAPFLLLILIAVFLKEHVGWHRWLAVGIGFVGVIVLAGPEFSNLNIGYIYGALAVLCISFSAIVIRKIGRDEYLPLYGVYPPLFIAVLNAPAGLANFTPVALFDIGLFALYGSFVIGGLLMTTYSMAKIKEMAIVAPFQYTQIIWGVLFGYFLFGDIPVKTTYIGLILIIGAGLYMIYREHKVYRSAQKSR
ncbi:MAG: DMT family transporter [Pseudomonadota bacterium]